jgi:hypothetical protein
MGTHFHVRPNRVKEAASPPSPKSKELPLARPPFPSFELKDLIPHLRRHPLWVGHPAALIPALNERIYLLARHQQTLALQDGKLQRQYQPDSVLGSLCPEASLLREMLACQILALKPNTTYGAVIYNEAGDYLGTSADKWIRCTPGSGRTVHWYATLVALEHGAANSWQHRPVAVRAASAEVRTSANCEETGEHLQLVIDPCYPKRIEDDVAVLISHSVGFDAQCRARPFGTG